MSTLAATVLDIAYLGVPPLAVALAIIRNEHRIHRKRP